MTQRRQDAAVATEHELDDVAVARLWAAVFRRARADARGSGCEPAVRREARRWLANGRALDVLTSFGVDRRRAEELVAAELEGIRHNGKGRR